MTRMDGSGLGGYAISLTVRLHPITHAVKVCSYHREVSSLDPSMAPVNTVLQASC
jgi:hypothetical protein